MVSKNLLNPSPFSSAVLPKQLICAAVLLGPSLVLAQGNPLPNDLIGSKPQQGQQAIGTKSQNTNGGIVFGLIQGSQSPQSQSTSNVTTGSTPGVVFGQIGKGGGIPGVTPGVSLPVPGAVAPPAATTNSNLPLTLRPQPVTDPSNVPKPPSKLKIEYVTLDELIAGYSPSVQETIRSSVTDSTFVKGSDEANEVMELAAEIAGASAPAQAPSWSVPSCAAFSALPGGGSGGCPTGFPSGSGAQGAGGGAGGGAAFNLNDPYLPAGLTPRGNGASVEQISQIRFQPSPVKFSLTRLSSRQLLRLIRRIKSQAGSDNGPPEFAPIATDPASFMRYMGGEVPGFQPYQGGSVQNQTTASPSSFDGAAFANIRIPQVDTRSIAELSDANAAGSTNQTLSQSAQESRIANTSPDKQTSPGAIVNNAFSGLFQ